MQFIQGTHIICALKALLANLNNLRLVHSQSLKLSARIHLGQKTLGVDLFVEVSGMEFPCTYLTIVCKHGDLGSISSSDHTGDPSVKVVLGHCPPSCSSTHFQVQEGQATTSKY